MNRAWVKNKIDVTTAGWTTVASPIDCNYVDFRNAGSETPGEPDDDIYLRTDVTNPIEEETISPGFQDAITAPFTGRDSRALRFSVGDILGYVKSKTGTQRLVITFLK